MRIVTEGLALSNLINVPYFDGNNGKSIQKDDDFIPKDDIKDTEKFEIDDEEDTDSDNTISVKIGGSTYNIPCYLYCYNREKGIADPMIEARMRRELKAFSRNSNRIFSSPDFASSFRLSIKMICPVSVSCLRNDDGSFSINVSLAHSINGKMLAIATFVNGQFVGIK